MFIGLYFIIFPKELFGRQIIGVILLVASLIDIFYGFVPEENHIDKFRKHRTLVEYCNKIDEIATSTLSEILKNELSDNKKDPNFVFDSYLKVQELWREYIQKEADEI